MKKVRIIHGPNLNFTGIREPEVYGRETLADINAYVTEKGKELGLDVTCFQSNHEGGIIDELQKCYFEGVDGIVLNPGAYTHYSYAIRDAVASVHIPTIEVHLSDITKREDFRKVSVISPVCLTQISGHGKDSYVLGLQRFAQEFVKKD